MVVTMSQWPKLDYNIQKKTLNLPIKSFRSTFTEAALNIIVKYKNDYGSFNTNDWEDVSSDIIYLLRAILIYPIIKRNDRPSLWFSDDATIGHDRIKHIMSGRKFLHIIRYLHTCDTNKEVSREHLKYDPLFKVRDFRKIWSIPLIVCLCLDVACICTNNLSALLDGLNSRSES